MTTEVQPSGASKKQEFRLNPGSSIVIETNLPILVVNNSYGPRDIQVYNLPQMGKFEPRTMIQMVPTKRTKGPRS